MRVLGYVNFIGVLGLAVLCVLQGKHNSALNLQLIDLEKTRQHQVQTIAERDATIKRVSADLDDFRNRLTLAEQELKKDETRIKMLARERDRIALQRDGAIAEREQLKVKLAEWMAAAKERDEAIKKLNESIQALIKDRDDTHTKFNDLVVKCNALVKDLNEARAKLAGKH